MSHPFVSESSSDQNLSILPVLHHFLSNANATSCHVLQPASRFLQWSSESRALRSPQQPGGDGGMGDGLFVGSPGLASVGRAPVQCLEQARGRSGSW